MELRAAAGAGDWRSDLLTRCAEIDGVAISDSMFGTEPAVWVGRREVAHAEGPEVVDVRLTRSVIRARRAELSRDPRVVFRSAGSDWIEVRLRDPNDLPFAVGLIRDAVDANRGDAPVGAPPTGAELARRRRFH